MLDSDYLEDGKHPTVREGLSYVTLAIIGCSLAYFAAVIWHEIVIELFPFLKCCQVTTEAPRKSSFDAAAVEMAEGGFAARAHKQQKSEDATLMTVEEQVKMKKLLAMQQDEIRGLKKDLASASKNETTPAKAKVVKKKKGFGLFSPPKPEAGDDGERLSASVDMADAYQGGAKFSGTNPLRKKG